MPITNRLFATLVFSLIMALLSNSALGQISSTYAAGISVSSLANDAPHAGSFLNGNVPAAPPGYGWFAATGVVTLIQALTSQQGYITTNWSAPRPSIQPTTSSEPLYNLHSLPTNQTVTSTISSGENTQAQQTEIPQYAPDRVIIKFKQGILAYSVQSMIGQLNATSRQKLSLTGREIWKISIPVKEAIETYQNHPFIEYIEPDYVINVADTIPDDTHFSQLWGLNNTGQENGTVGADINATEAWDLETGDHNVIVAVIDTGVDYNHEDIADNIWTNPGEIAGDGVDNDGNGYVDDVYGIDTWNRDSDPMDDNSHGTHVAGIIGAKGNNNRGVVGVSWDVQIMSLKFLNSAGNGYTSGAVEAIQYAIDHGAHIMNNSWGQIGQSQTLYDAVLNARNAGILFVAAAGNSSTNTDVSPYYPASYDLDNIISVAATDRNDNKAWFSNYGKTSVDVAAPGVSILSTVPGNSYSTKEGTSMATPYVSGLAALIKAYYPASSWSEIKDRILYTTDFKASLADMVLTKGRINAYNALTVAPHPQLTYYGVNIDDADAMQPNGIWEPGETIRFYVMLRNGWARATSVNATLLSSDPYVTFQQASSSYGDINAGEVKENQTPFMVSLAAETPPGHATPIEVSLTYQYDTEVYSLTIPFTYIPAGGNAWLYLTDRANDSNATWPNDLWEPGETIDFYVAIQNDWASAEDINATLSSPDSYVTIQQASASYGNRFLITEIKENETPFVIRLAPQAARDRQIPFSLVLNYRRNGQTETRTINFTYNATDVKIVDFPDPGRAFLNTSFTVDGDVGYMPTFNNNVLWSFSLLTGELFDPDGLALPGSALASDPFLFSNKRVAIPGWFPSQSVFVVDVSDPANLRTIGVIAFPATTNIQGQNIAVDEDGVIGYVAGTADDRLYSFNVDTLRREDSDGLALPGNADRIARAGDRVAVVDTGNGRIMVADVSNPGNLTLAGVIELPGTNTFASNDNIVVARDGRTGFISSNEGVLYSFDVVDLQLLDPDGFSLPASGEHVAIHETTIAATLWNGITFVDVSDPTNMQLISNANFGLSVVAQNGSATAAFLANGRMAAMPVAYPSNLLFVFDIATGVRAAAPLSVCGEPSFLKAYGSDHLGLICPIGNASVQLISHYPVPKPNVIINPLTLNVELNYGEAVTQSLTITNDETLGLVWNLAESPAVTWLSTLPISGTVPPSSNTAATLSFTAPITPGVYTTTLEITSNDLANSPLPVPITMTVTAPDIIVEPKVVMTTLASEVATTHTLAISNTGTGSLVWNLAESPAVTWLSTLPISGTVPPSSNTAATLTFTAPIIPGVYTTTLEITSNDLANSPLPVPVTMNVTAPDIAVEPKVVMTTLASEAATTHTLAISNSGTADLVWNLAESPTVTWLSTLPISGTVSPSSHTTATLTFTAPIIPGVYTTTLEITSNDLANSPLPVPITMTVPHPIYLPIILRN